QASRTEIEDGVPPMSTTPVAAASPQALPPGPRSPAWWQFVRFASDPLRLLDECHRRYGDAFTLDVAGVGRFVMLSDPEAVRAVSRGGREVVHAFGGEPNQGFIEMLGRNSVVFLSGPRHARQRRVLVPPFRGERMKTFFHAMRQETLEGVRAWPVDAPRP